MDMEGYPKFLPDITGQIRICGLPTPVMVIFTVAFGIAPLLCSLEVLDEDGNVTKAEMFTKQTIKAKQSVDSVEVF